MVRVDCQIVKHSPHVLWGSIPLAYQLMDPLRKEPNKLLACYTYSHTIVCDREQPS
jgi:hypothetical protein